MTESPEDILNRHGTSEIFGPRTAANGAAEPGHCSSGKALALAPLGLILWSDINSVGITDRLVKGLIGEQSFAVIAGPTGAAKTFLALDMAVHIALGWPWFGRKVKRCGVLYLAAEGQTGLRKRIAALKQHYGLAAAVNVPFALYPAPIDLVTDNSGAEKVVAQVQALNAVWIETPVGIVIPDTLARCFGSGDESATRDMSAFVSRCDSIRNKAEVAVTAVHHFGKDESKGMRGSIALKAAADTVIEITGIEGTRTCRVEKQKDGAHGEMFAFNLIPVDLGRDEDDAPITSCIVEQVASEPIRATRSKKPITKEYLVALDYLGDVLADHSELVNRNGVPPCTRVVHIDLWRDRLKQRGLHDGTEAGKKWFQRCRNALIADSRITVDDPYVWIVR